MAPRRDGAQKPARRPQDGAQTAGAEEDAAWIVLVELAPAPGREFRPEGIDAMIEYLEPWQPTGLWEAGRCAIQLRVPAPTSDEALRRAVAYHGEAAGAAGLPPPTLVRAEVMTVQHLERSWQDDSGTDAQTDGAGHDGLLSGEVYAATRGLVAASTPAEVAAVLRRFVTTVGGTVEAGLPRYAPGTVDIDLRIDEGDGHHATAEALSVAGLMLESALPTLLTDARLTLARLRQHQPPAEHPWAAGATKVRGQ